MSDVVCQSDAVAPRHERNEPMIVVDHVSMVFNIASERIGSLKEYAIKIVKRELMFKEFKALDDVSFTVNRGDVFGLMGTNGSGKSTMLKIVAGVLDPSSGSCIVNGTIAPLIELGAGFDLELSARENIYLNGALLGYSKQFIEDHFDSIVEFADVEGFLDMPMKNYSSGMVARIAFAIATEVVPDILIVDEVLSVGDFMFQEKCERRIRSLIEDHGVTVLIVSHNSDQVARLCNKAIWIEKGTTKAIGDASDVCDLYRILGGHAGSEEAVEKVQSIFENQAEVPSRLTATLYADSSYGTAVKLAESVADTCDYRNMVLAPAESEQACFIANSLAGLFDTSVLLYRNGILPDSTLDFLLDRSPERVIVVEAENWSSNQVPKMLEGELDCDICVISGKTNSELAVKAFDFGCEHVGGWSDTCILTHNSYITDRMSLMGYAYLNKIPVFYTTRQATLDDETKNALNANGCRHLLVVSGTKGVPSECVESIGLDSVSSCRLCYKDGYEAAARISEWVTEQDGRFSMDEPIIASALYPTNAFTIGAFAAHEGRVVLMEDPQNLDSIVQLHDFLRSHRDDIDQLTFIGDSSIFSKTDRLLLAQALVSDAASV